jgi:DNA polymerase I-like protein with 3'-5' exonuclease and polymerase domains
MKTLFFITPSEFRAVLQRCSGKTIVIDTETTGVRWWSDTLTTVGFLCTEAGVEGCIDWGAPVLEGQEHSEELLAWGRQVKEIANAELKPGTNVIMHNGKFDMGMLGVPYQTCNSWNIFDTTVMIHMWDSRMLKGLEAAERELLGSNSKRAHIEKSPTDPKIRKKPWRWESNVRQDYCLNDCRVTLQLAQALKPMLEKMGLTQLFLKDMQYLKLIYYTEHLGITLDQEFVGKAAMALLAHQKELEEQLWDSVGYKFNWRSNKQLSKAIYEDMGIAKPINPFAAKGDKGAYRTKLGFERIKELKGGMYNDTMTSTFLLMEKVHHPLGELISSLREASKLSKVCNQWLDLVDSEGVIHSNFNLTGTRTGRLSSSKPNLANVPSDVRSRFTQGLFSGGLVRTEEYNLRNAFVARPGHYMLSIDYKQQEMRMFAYISQDENLLGYVREGKDIHLMIALAVWGDCGKEQNKIHREWSKTIAFGLLYGMTTGSLEHKLGMTRAQAQKVIEDYWGAFPRIRPALFETVETCKEFGFIRYWSGRIWREETEMFMYKGMNALVQGGCADLLSICAMRAQKYVREHDCGNIVSYIYDEILYEIKENCIEKAANDLALLMQIPDVLGLPFLTECKVGRTYGDMVEMKRDENGKWLLPDKSEEQQ